MNKKKKEFYLNQIWVHNETKLNDYLKEIGKSKNHFLKIYLQPNNEFLELGLNSFINSKTKNQFYSVNY